jgi:hypothetical protein
MNVAEGTTARRTALLFVACSLLASGARAQGVRDLTRPDSVRDTAVTETQAVELTLTLTAVARRTLQTWVRTAGTVSVDGNTITANVKGPEAGLVAVGQRVRAFPPESISSISQARVSRVVRNGDVAIVDAEIGAVAGTDARRYVMEILADRGQFLSVPNEAIIEEGDRTVVYLQTSPGHFVPREVRTGLMGELYTEIVDGLEAGEEVVTLGSFFIDAEHKLNYGGQPLTDDAHQDH